MCKIKKTSDEFMYFNDFYFKPESSEENGIKVRGKTILISGKIIDVVLVMTRKNGVEMDFHMFESFSGRQVSKFELKR